MKIFLKRAVSVLMLLTVALSGLCISSEAQSYKDGECTVSDYTLYSAGENACSYLQMLGITEEIDMAFEVTRGQAVSSIIRALGLEDVAQLSGSMYTYDEKMALLAYECGILSGSSPSEWELDSPVTGAQLSKMLVVALGYGAIITSPNAYPAEYLSCASKLGITKGTVAFNYGNISGQNFAIMLANAMKADIMQIAGGYPDDIMYEIASNTTLESIYLEIKDMAIGEGIVESDFYQATVRDAKCDYSRIRIDGRIYTCESEKLKGLVGYRVEFAYNDSKTESDRQIIGARVSDQNRIYEFDFGHNASLQDGTLYYWQEGEKEGKITLSADAVYVVNNSILSSYSPGSIDFADYELKLIDNNDDKKCDVVFLTKSESIIVNYVKDDIIYFSYGKLNSKSILDLRDYDKDSDTLVIRDVQGTPKALGDITEDTSISVIASEDLKYIQIIILPEEQSGRFEEYNSQYNTVTVDGKVYKLKISADKITLGNSYIFRINENNEIFYLESIVADCSYIVDVGSMSQGLSSGIQVKVYDNVNGIQVFPVADKLTLDGTSYSSEQAISAAVQKGVLAYVSLNSQNEIKKIDSMAKFGEKAKRVYRKDASGFNDTARAASVPFKFDSSTAFFYIPDSGNDNDFGNIVPLKNKDEYTTQAYELNEDTGFVKAVVVEVDTDKRSNNYITYTSDIGIVSQIRQVLDSDGQGIYRVDGYTDGKPFSYTSGHYDDVFSVCSSLKVGDVIRYITNYNSEIVRIKKVISLSDANEFFHDGKDTTDEKFFGRVITLSKNAITNYSDYLCHEMNVSMTLSYNNLAFMRFSAVLENPVDPESQFSNYYCYDKRRKEVTVASIDDIITYREAGDAASKVFVQRSKSDVQFIAIVKD